MSKDKISKTTAILVCLGMIMAVIPVALASVEDSDQSMRTRKDGEDWGKPHESNFTSEAPIIDGNLSEWNRSAFRKVFLGGGTNSSEMNIAFNNNRTELYMAVEIFNATIPSKMTRDGDDEPMMDMILLAFDTEDNWFNYGDNVFIFSVMWNMTDELEMVSLDTYLESDLWDRDEEGNVFNMTGDPQQDGELVINFTGEPVENATGEYILEISFPLNSGDEFDFSIEEGYDLDYGFDYIFGMQDINTNEGYGTGSMPVDLAFLDTDGDGYADLWEDDLGTNKTNATDHPDDFDMDFWPDAYDDDDDNDGYSDADEIAAGSDPMDGDSWPPDMDDDGIPDIMDDDMDGDGFSNWDENAAGTDPSDPSSHPAIVVGDLINNGLDWLAARQDGDGSWEDNPGTTSLCLLAFLNNNITEGNATVDDAIGYLLGEINPDWDENNTPIGRDATYSVSMAILALKATMNADYTDEINALGEWLVATQWDEDNIWREMNNSNPNYGGWRYGDSHCFDSDLSVTQWALMGLDAWGNLSKDDAVWTNALSFVEACQTPSGGFTYMPDEGQKVRNGGFHDGSYGSMSAAGLWSLMLCGLNNSDARVQGAIGWLQQNYTWEENAHSGENWMYYYFLTLAKALTMVGMDTIEVVNGTYASDGVHVWMDDMVENVTARKTLNESYWQGSNEGSELTTAYVILSLETQTLPEGANLSAVFTLHSNATLHIYDDDGRHVGVVLGTDKVEVGIPGAIFKYMGHTYSYSATLQTVVEGIGNEQIVLPIAEAGAYTLELVGISTGGYELEIDGYINGQGTGTSRYTGTIAPGEIHTTNVIVTAMKGPLTIFAQEPGKNPTMSISPAAIVGDAQPGDTLDVDVTFTETSELGPVEDVVITLQGLSSGTNTIPATELSVDVSDFDLAAGGTQTVTFTIDVPDAQADGIYTGNIKVERPTGLRYIPVNLDVYTLTYDIGLTSPGSAKDVKLDGNVAYSVVVNNLANGPDVIDIAIADNTSNWKAELSVSSLSLAAGGSDTVTVTVTPPTGAVDGDKGTVTVKATSQGMPGLNKTLPLVTTVNMTPTDLRIDFILGPFLYDDATPIDGATVTLVNALTGENQTKITDANGKVTGFKMLAAVLNGTLKKGDDMAVSFTLSLLAAHDGATLNTTVLTGWTAPTPPEITLKLGPFTDKDGNVIQDATICITVGNITKIRTTDAGGFVEFKLAMDLKGTEVTVDFSHDDYEDATGKITSLADGTVDPGNFEDWATPEKKSDTSGDGTSNWIWIVIGILVTLAILVIVIFIVIRKRSEEPITPLEDELSDEGMDEDISEDDDFGDDDAPDDGWDDEPADESDEDDGWGDEDDGFEDDYDDDYDDEANDEEEPYDDEGSYDDEDFGEDGDLDEDDDFYE